jgi:deazaflavin-dependent oxidoreductase (nitroreductase family)
MTDKGGGITLENGGTPEESMIPDIADQKVLYLTTVGRRTGLRREIEIWFVVYRDRFYVLAETGEAAAWVKNIRHNPEVVVRIGERQIGARARVLDRETDRELWQRVAAIADRKYGWGDGLPVELSPLASAF